MLYKLDLHIHTKASKCFKDEKLSNAEINNAIVKQAKNKVLDLIAVTDHYTFKNYQEIKDAARKENIKVVPGMEFSLKAKTPEKVSLIALFDEQIEPFHLKNKIFSRLNIPPEAEGNGYFLIENGIPEILDMVRENKGLVFSAHQDKNEGRMLFVPDLVKCGINLFDLRDPAGKDEFSEKFSKYNIIPLTFSDSHKIEDVGKYFMELPLDKCSFFGFKNYINSL
ncbi:MAG: PHP domain-containing protein [bacterium]